MPTFLRASSHRMSRAALAATAAAIAVTTAAAPLPFSSTPAFADESAPSGLSSMPAGSTAMLSWVPNSAPAYDVLYAGHGIVGSIRVDEIDGTSHTVSELIPGGTYRFRVRSNYGSSVGPWSELHTFSVALTAPSSAPSATQTGQGELTFAWPVPAGVSTFDVLYAGRTTAGATIADTVVTGVPAGAVISGLANGSYRFRVRSTSPYGRSGWSSLGTATLAASAPTGLASAPTATSATLTWSSTGAASYDVLYAGTGLANDVRVDAVTATSYQLPPLTPGGSYRFRVRSRDGAAVSAWSELHTFTATVPTPTQPTAVQIGDGALMFDWPAVAQVATFDLLMAGKTSEGVIYPDTVFSNVTVGHVVAGLADGSYRFRVRTANRLTPGAWSELGRAQIGPVVDTDQDGLSDDAEGTLFETDPMNPDSDDDGLSDGDEVTFYGTLPNAADSDGDGLSDTVELSVHGTNPRVFDGDSDGLSDGDEVTVYGTNPADADTDTDGLSDGDEVNVFGTSPNNADSDFDGLSDLDELFVHETNPNSTDSDADGLSDFEEVVTYRTNPNDPDTDTDGLSDAFEVFFYATDPNNSDSDTDGISDGEEIDVHGTNPNSTDSDSDGLSDYDEIFVHGTNPSRADSDSDGLSDYAELFVHSTNPLSSDSDGDNLPDNDEIDVWLTNPNSADTDGDGYSDFDEIFVYATDPLDADSLPFDGPFDPRA